MAEASRRAWQGHTPLQQQVLQEILASEATYIHGLEQLTGLYLYPLRLNGLLPEEALALIFSNVEALVTLNRTLHTLMLDVGILAAFQQCAPFLKIYSLYAEGFERSLAKVGEWSKRSKGFARFKQAQAQRPECHGVGLEALLLAPIQRLPRYKLLLEKLLDVTGAGDPLLRELQPLVEAILHVNDHVNLSVKSQDGRFRLLDLQRRLVGPGLEGLIQPGRSLVAEFQLWQRQARGRKGLRATLAFLLSDALLLGRPGRTSSLGTASTVALRAFLPLQRLRLRLEPAAESPALRKGKSRPAQGANAPATAVRLEADAERAPIVLLGSNEAATLGFYQALLAATKYDRAELVFPAGERGRPSLTPSFCIGSALQIRTLSSQHPCHHHRRRRCLHRLHWL
jgi:hypothetical protein